MPAIRRIAAHGDDMTAWRRHLHAHPELGFDCFETARFMAAHPCRLAIAWIGDGIATTGLVAMMDDPDRPNLRRAWQPGS